MILRKAYLNEADVSYQCIEDARIYHSSMGFLQWHPGYPTLQTIQDDIIKGIGFVFAEDDEILGYCCIMTGDEPAYHTIDGAWKTERPYAVVHRMAFRQLSRGKGFSKKALSLIKDYRTGNGIEAIRVDTQEENKVMQHILDRENFQYCGLSLLTEDLNLHTSGTDKVRSFLEQSVSRSFLLCPTFLKLQTFWPRNWTYTPDSRRYSC